MKPLRTVFAALSLSIIFILFNPQTSKAGFVPRGAEDMCPAEGCGSAEAACEAAQSKWPLLYIEFRRIIDIGGDAQDCIYLWFVGGVEKAITIDPVCDLGDIVVVRGMTTGCFTPPSNPPTPRDKGPDENDCTPGVCCQKTTGSSGGGPNTVAANPVSLAYGNKFQIFTDFESAGPFPISFKRYYSAQFWKRTSLSFAWRHEYLRALLPEGGDWTAPTWIDAERHTGRTLRFTKNGSVFEPDSDMDISLIQITGGWEYRDGNGTVETYDATGVLQSISRADGFTLTLTYVSGNLDKVTGSFGREITFSYTDFSGTDHLTSVTAPDGVVYKYEYDGALGGDIPAKDRLFQVLYPDATASDDTDNPRRTYHYEDSRFPYALTGITDETGNRFATWTYDQYLRATLSKHGSGDADKATFSYDDINNITTLTNALGKQTKYHFSTITGVSKLTQVEGVASTNCVATDSTYAYDTNGFVDEIVDREGNKTTFVRNSRGLPTSVTEAKDDPNDERTTTATWHSTLRLPTQVVRPGLTTDLTYDAKGNVLTRTDTDTTTHSVPYSTNGQTRVWTYTYTYNGTTPELLEKLEIDGPRAGAGDKTTYEYDSDGYLTKVTNALGHISDITSVDGMGRPTSVSSPNGVITNLVYDERGRLLSRTVDPGANEATTQYTYNAAGLVTRARLPNKTELSYVYDDAQRLTQVSNTAGEKIVYTLNDLGNVTKEEVKSTTGAIKRTLTREFDELGRLMKHIGASLQETNYTYDKNDLLKTVTDPKSNATTRAYDALNRLAKITDAATNDALYDRDGADNLTGVTDQRSLQTTYVHNGFGDVIRRVSPDTGTTDYVYDSAGNLTQKTDARSIVTNYAYDDLNRRTSKTFPANTSENVTYTFDDFTGGNKGKGRLTKIQDSSGSTEFVYDARGNVVTETRTIGTTVYATSYAYDLVDNLTEITYPSGRKVTYVRDALGRVTSVMTKKNGTAAEVVIASNITYLPFGPIASLRYGNGQIATFTHDQDYRVTDIITTDSTTNVQDLDYGYDAASNITSITDNLATSLNQTFDYDALHRLTDATGVYGDLDYGYDAVGNRTYKTVDLGTPDTLTYATTSNRLLTVSDGVVTRSMTYTANGNLATDSRDGGLTFNYSHDNRLTQVTDQATPTPATIADYVYNDLGQRVVKDTGGGNVTHYHYDRTGAVIAESESDGTLLREYIRLAALPLAVIDAAAATTPAEVTVDNDDTAATSTGTWTTETALSGYLGADYASAEDGDGTGDFTWTPAVPSNGPYQVYARWPEDATTGSSATYTVHHAGGTTDVTVDQKKDGAEWQLLGTFVMNTAAGHKVVLSDKADPPAGPEEVVVDNQATGVTVTGSWASGTALTGYHGFDYLSIASGVGAGDVSWDLPVTSAGRYKVFARWTQASTHVQYARYTVHHDGGTSTVSVDQRGGAGSWNLLGSFELDPLNDPKVVLSGEITQGAAGTVIADAVRVVRDDANAIELVRDNDQDTRWGIWSHNYGTNTCCTGFLGNNYRREGTNPGSGAWFQWQLHTVIANTGWYKVYTRWPYGRTDDASEIRYAINHKNGAVTRTVNQRTNGGEWNLLGVYEFAPGPDRFNRNITTFAKANAGQVAMADAVRLVPVDGPEVNEIIVDNTPSPGNSTGLNFTRLDNGVAGASSVGPWLTSNWTGGGPFWGSNFAYIDTTGSDSFTWTPTLPETGTYDVYVRWSQAADRASQATYAVHHTGGSTQVVKDQRSGGGVLQHLGQFDMAPGQNHRVVLTAPSGRLAADEIVFILSPGSAAATGTWTSDSGEDNGIHWGTDFLKIAPGAGSNDFTWTPEVPSSGAYKVYARWTSGSDRTSEATYTIHHAGGSTAVTVNQRGSGGSWNLLGTFTLTPGSNHRVVLTDDAPDGSWVIADAIKFEKVPPVPRQVAADAIKLVKNDAELVKYVHADHLGSPQKMTDNTGAVVWDAAFTPFGLEDSITGTAANNKRFPGQYFDAETALHYNYWRDYDPTVGRYIQSDPIGLRAGLNTYAYVGGNPVSYVDPRGLNAAYCIRNPWQIGCQDFSGGGTGGRGSEGAAGAMGLGALIGMCWKYFFGDDDQPEDESSSSGSPSGEPTDGDQSGDEGTTTASPPITPEDLSGKTPDEIRDLAKELGLVPHGDKNDPDYPRKWKDPVTGKERLRIDNGHVEPSTGKPYDNPNAASPHVHGYGPEGKKNKIVDKVNNDPHFPLKPN